VIKLLEPGDEAHSFETLYDTAVSVHDFERLRTHDVKSVEDLKPRLYELVLIAEINMQPQVRVRLKATDERRVRAKLRELMQPGQAFLQRLIEEMSVQIFNSNDTTMATPGFLEVADPAPDVAPDWDFLPFPGEVPTTPDDGN